MLKSYYKVLHVTKLRKRPDSATNSLYKKFRNRVASELKKSKKKYFQEYFHSNIENMKLLINLIISTDSRANAVNKFKDTNGACLFL